MQQSGIEWSIVPHVEFVVLNLAFSMVFSMLWLKTVRPLIDWYNGAVAF